MTDVQLLLVTFLALCVIQSVRIVPSDLLILQKGILRGWRITRPSFRLGSGSLSIVLLDPFSLSGSAFAVRPVPYAISTAGFINAGPEDASAAGSSPPRLITPEQFSQIQAVGTELIFDKERLLSFLHADHAHSTAGLVHGMGLRDRPSSTHSLLQSWFDDSACRIKIEKMRSAIRLLRFGSLLFCLLMICFLVVWDRVGFNAARWLLLPVIVDWILSICWLWRSNRSLFPASPRLRFFAVAEAIFYPISLVRVCDAFTLQATELFHPVTAAIALEQSTLASRISASTLRKLRFPVRDRIPGGQIADSVRSFTLDRVRIEVEQLLSKKGMDAEAILNETGRFDTSSAYYCPRCLSGYRTAIGECPDCPGVELLPNDLKSH